MPSCIAGGRTYALPMLFAAALLCGGASAQTSSTGGNWQFAVSGDSRNCGDVVMPAIAADVLQRHSKFYWHLGDFRAIYTFDEDFTHQPEHKGRLLTLSEYQGSAWQDFLDSQITPFGDLQVFLGIGNHETIPPKTREEYISQFADWLEKPEIRAQRLRDDCATGFPHSCLHARSARSSRTAPDRCASLVRACSTLRQACNTVL